MKDMIVTSPDGAEAGEDERLGRARALLVQFLLVTALVKLPIDRKKLRRKWRAHTSLLVPLCVALMEEVPEGFQGLDFDAAALRANFRREQSNDNLKHMLLHVAELAADQVLADRAQVYDQLTAVLKSVESTLENPSTPAELLRRMEESSRALRAARDRYNDQINKKRLRTVAAQPRLGDGSEK